MKRRHCDPLTQQYNCASCGKNFNTSKIRNHHEQFICQMSKRRAGSPSENSSGKKPRRIVELTTKLVDDYKTLKAENLADATIKVLLKRNIDEVDINSLRAQIENLNQRDHDRIKELSEKISTAMREPWTLNPRPQADTEEDELKLLNALTDLKKSKRLYIFIALPV
jgi:hypothetical protein